MDRGWLPLIKKPEIINIIRWIRIEVKHNTPKGPVANNLIRTRAIQG